MKLREITEIANDTGVFAERGYNLKNFANRIIELGKQQRTWIGLTAEEREQVQAESYGKVPHHVALIAAVEAKLKEKNT